MFYWISTRNSIFQCKDMFLSISKILVFISPLESLFFHFQKMR